MPAFAFAAVVVTLVTWALVDVYLYSTPLDPLRQRAAVWQRSRRRWRAILGSGLQCPYCLGHWVAAALVLSVMALPNSFGKNLSLLDGFFLATLAARVSTMLRENVLRPIAADLETDHPADESGAEPPNGV